MSDNNCTNLQANQENCPCTAKDCERRGNCCLCLTAHTENDSLTSCIRLKVEQSQPFRDHITALINEAS